MSLTVARAGVYSTYPMSVSVSMSPPVLYFLNPENPDAESAIAENGTVASATAFLSFDPNVVDNPGFDGTALPWVVIYNSSSSTLVNNTFAYYVDSDVDEQGLVAIGTYVPPWTFARYWYAFIVQEFTVPDNVSSFDITVRYRPVSTAGITYLRIIIYDVNTSSIVYKYNETVSGQSYYTWFNATATASLYTTDKYYFLVGLYSRTIFTLWWGTNIQLNVGYASIELSSMSPAFAGELIRINVTDSVYAKLRIRSYSSNGSFTGYINLVGENSSSIIINESIPLVTETSVVLLNASDNQLYPSGYIEASIRADNASTYMTIDAVIIYVKGGAEVEYPITIVFRS